MAYVIVYETGPIDHWDGWIDLSKRQAMDFASEYDEDGSFAKEVDALWTDAQKVASEGLGWEGDIIQGPFLSALPQPAGCCSSPMIGWKQSNNGTTFIASRIALGHLDDEDGWSSAKLVEGEVRRRHG